LFLLFFVFNHLIYLLNSPQIKNQKYSQTDNPNIYMTIYKFLPAPTIIADKLEGIGGLAAREPIRDIGSVALNLKRRFMPRVSFACHCSSMLLGRPI
tara:strand:+ start:5694 stop:5984 length:291 start_codon:yes stop_codon:yes gene_type:complete